MKLVDGMVLEDCVVVVRLFCMSIFYFKDFCEVNVINGYFFEVLFYVFLVFVLVFDLQRKWQGYEFEMVIVVVDQVLFVQYSVL